MSDTIEIDPTSVKRLANAFCHAKILLTASEIGVFADLAANGPSTGAQLCDRLDVHPRGIRDLLHGLVLLDLLDHCDGVYSNSAIAAATLVPGGPRYIGGFLRRADHMLYPAWGKLTDAIRTGVPQTPGAGPEAFSAMLADPAHRAQYLTMMDSANGLIGGHLADVFDWDAVTTVTDVGGCRGNLAATLVRSHPGLRATVFDLPVLATSFDDHMEALGTAEAVTFVGGDFFTDPLPPSDVVVLGHVLHNWSPEEREFLVRRAFEAVLPGGAVLIYDAMVPEEPGDLARILVSLNMLLVTEGGSEYTAAQGREWLRAAGCTFTDVAPLGPTDTLLVGRKP